MNPSSYELHQVNETWWAPRPDGGSLRLKDGSYWFYQNKTKTVKRRWTTGNLPRLGPWRTLAIAAETASRILEVPVLLDGEKPA